jgi:Fur family ferric uptake transcriptional regulator
MGERMPKGEKTTTQRVVVGQRSTKQRVAVASLVRETSDFRSAQEFHQLLRERGQNIGLTTVYRALQAMADVGEIDVLVNQDGEAMYRHCGQSHGHHHHLVCRSCGLAIEIFGPSVEKWTQTIADEHGFTAVSHTLDVFGLCPKCTKTFGSQ